MAGIKDIKNRIKSVNSTRQITKAMNLVSTAKLKRARDKVEGVRPYFKQLQDVVSDIIKNSGGIENPYFEVREVKRTLVVVVTADRGLCGGYNTNSIKKALSLKTEGELSLITIGNKASDYFRKRDFDVKESFVHLSEGVNSGNAKQIANKIMELFINREVDEVYLVYNRFISTISFEPTSIRLLPMIVIGGEERTTLREPLYEPSPEKVLDVIVPQFIIGILYGALLEASASEQSSRMTAMNSATENASSMIDDLTDYFKTLHGKEDFTTELDKLA